MYEDAKGYSDVGRLRSVGYALKVNISVSIVMDVIPLALMLLNRVSIMAKNGLGCIFTYEISRL